MAGITHLEQFQPQALAGVVDATVQNVVPSFADRFLPTVEDYNRKFVYDIIKNSQFLAAYIGKGAEPPVVDRNEVADRHMEVAQFGLENVLTYEELEAINHARQAAQNNAIDRVLADSIDLVEATVRLTQLAKLDALLKGNHEVSGKGVRFNFDFGIPEENRVALSADNDFNTADFDVLGFLMDQVDAYIDTNGKAPDFIGVSRELNAKILRNKNIVIESGRPAGSTRASQDDLNEVLDAFGIPPITVVSQRHMVYQDNYTGQTVRREYMPVNRIVMLSDGIGEYKLGPTLENNFRPGILLRARDKEDPIRSVIDTVGAGFPLVENPYLIRHIDAFTP